MLDAMILVVILVLAPQSSVPPAGSTERPSVAQASPEEPWPPANVTRVVAGVTAPRVLKSPKPRYTAEAMRAKIAGIVVMELVVLPDGTVGRVHVKQSLDQQFGLDDEAVKTVKQWRFEPGKKDGVAVPVIVSVDMTFTLK